MISCLKLKNKDVTSKSDPCCVMYARHDDDWVEVGRTETIMNCLDPKFLRNIEVDYEFERTQKVRFIVYDIDNKSEKLTDDDFLGQVDTTVAEIVSGSPLTLVLQSKKSGNPMGGSITLRVEESSGGKQETLKMLFKADKLDKMDTVGKSDPFLEFSRRAADNKWQVVLKTEVVKNNLSPTWRPIHVRTSVLCGSDRDDPIKVDCKDYDSSSKQELIGTFTTSVSELIRHRRGHEWECINPAKVGKKKYENSGKIIMEYCEVED